MIATSTLAAAALVMAAASAATAAYGSEMQAQASQKSMNYQAQVAKNNATIDEQNAQATEQAGAQAAQAEGMKTAAQAGAVRAAVAANGLNPDAGSGEDLKQSVQTLGETDLIQIRNQTARAAFSQRVGGMSDAAQAQLDSSGAANAGAAGGINAANSLLSGGSSVSDKWFTYQKAGAFA